MLRIILLPAFISLIICAPTLAFAGATTSVGILDQVINERKALLPNIEDIRKNAISNYLDIKTVPKNPGPNDQVTVSIESFLSDMNKALIGWSINGKRIDYGIGKTSFSFKNGASGGRTNLSISITTNDGVVIIKELSWTPVGVTLFWEADTYTPPFYRGKPLLSPQAEVTVVAIPDNTGTSNSLSPGNLVYVWEKGGATMSDASGYGKNSFSFSGPKPYDEANVRVRVSSVDDTIKSEARVFLSLTNPFLLFYEKTPLLGTMYNRPFDKTFILSGQEFSIDAAPYFFSNDNEDGSSLKYSWLVNGGPVQNTGKSITLRNDKGEDGSSSISLSVRGSKKTFQSAGQSLVVKFTKNNPVGRPTF